MINGTLRNNLQWNINSYIFIQENALENVVCEMASILSRPQCVKWLRNAQQTSCIHSLSIFDTMVIRNSSPQTQSISTDLSIRRGGSSPSDIHENMIHCVQALIKWREGNHTLNVFLPRRLYIVLILSHWVDFSSTSIPWSLLCSRTNDRIHLHIRRTFPCLNELMKCWKYLFASRWDK